MKLESLAWIDAIVACWFAYLGASIGSFSNVVASRLPRGESIVHPGSRCPSCFTPIHWYDNVPVIGWLILRGRCRACHWPIPFRYVFVEILFALVFVILYLSHLRFAHPSRPFDFLIEGRWTLVVPFLRDSFLMSCLLIIALMRIDLLPVPMGFLVGVAVVLWGLSIADSAFLTELPFAEGVLAATLGGAIGIGILLVAHRSLSLPDPIVDTWALHPSDLSGLVLSGIALGPIRMMFAITLMAIFGLIIRGTSLRSFRQGVIPLATLLTVVSPIPNEFC